MTGISLIPWLTDEERAAIMNLPAETQRAVIGAAQDSCSGAPDAPGYKSSAAHHGIPRLKRWVAAVAGPIRRDKDRELDLPWKAVLAGIVEPRARACAREARARARDNLEVIHGGQLPNPTDDDAVPRLFWPTGWSPQRCRAADYFLAGATYTEVAESVGVHASTTARWWKHDQEFRQAVAAQRAVLNEHRMAKLHRLGDLVIDKVMEAIPQMTPAELIKLAPHLLDRIGVVKTERVEVTQQGPTAIPDPDEARKRLEGAQQQISEREAYLRELKARREALTADKGTA